MKIEPGDPHSLGATPREGGVNFALYSAHAEAVDLCLFDATGKELRLELPRRSGDVWHGFLPGASAGLRYGYRVHGPFAPEHGHRFNPCKLLIDPYARQLRGGLRHNASIYNVGHPDTDSIDSAPFVPRAEVVEPLTPLSPRAPIPWDRTLVYELHVRGFTQLHPAVPEAERGRLKGLGGAEVLAYLKALGVTTLELLPIQSYISEAHLIEAGLKNYWGYNTLAWFAVHDAYASHNGCTEMRELVQRIHDAGLEVILDVVYNHSCEGNELGPTLSLRGIDNASYYRLEQNDPARYVNDTGCGNTMNADHPAVRGLILDNLRHWTRHLGVDGFRFDLATTLGRSRHGFDPHGALLTQISTDPVLSHCKLIAEPWDVGPGGYRLGGFPRQWGEWNDRYRDSMRRFWRGDEGEAPEFARRFHGSADIFEGSARSATTSLNFITSHDGFTLRDLVSYSRRHNLANGEENRDGHSENYSDNCGEEGPSAEKTVLQHRAQRQRNLLATLLLSQGTPMLLAGDELGRSQQGNNNAYCQDNALNWLNWENIDEDLLEFTRAIIRLRTEEPLLRPDRYRHALPDADGQYLCWLGATGEILTETQWRDPGLHCFACCTGQRNADGEAGTAVVLLFNGSRQDQKFTLPGDTEWRRYVDTARTPAVCDGEPLPHPLALQAESLVLAKGTQVPNLLWRTDDD